MIRQLTEQDDDLCQKLIHQQPAENLFIIGDIEAFGYEEDFQQVWGDFDENGNLRGVLLKYRENFIPYSLGEFDAKGFATIINSHEDYRFVSGLKKIISQMEPYLSRELKSKRQLYYAKCDRMDSLELQASNIVKKITLSDLPKLNSLLKSIPEFKDGAFSIESRKKNIEKGVSRGYFIEEDGRFVSSASTTAENSLSAMVVAVCTDQNYKGKGYATQCVSHLCQELLEEGKELCLFYDNPEAGKIYKRIGFKDIGYWMMYTFK
ncbi:GNAT family N-acetyltransferase [Rossellomorea aquimaris]|uniref:GNAT family N-acetyltransferase n=1 Tax=Rossellomorea aquimaris TaxID=189382 RepID=UPI0007D05FD4|nr:GNAT family N-acetyltransferase [Rossellomorea aquimaris]